MLAFAFEKAGYDVLAADSPDAGRSLVSQYGEQVAVLVTDKNLRHPTQTGWDVARAARTERATLPIIYVTGDSAHEWPVQGVPRSRLIPKPFLAQEVLRAAATLLRLSE